MKTKNYKNELDVVNAAMEMAGLEKIRGFNMVAESYKNIIQREYTATRIRLLSKKDWEFATREEDILKENNKPIFELSYPPVKIIDKSKSIKKFKYGYNPKTNKNTIIVSEGCPDKLHVKYIEDVEDVEIMPCEFLKEFVNELANRFKAIFKPTKKHARHDHQEN